MVVGRGRGKERICCFSSQLVFYMEYVAGFSESGMMDSRWCRCYIFCLDIS